MLTPLAPNAVAQLLREGAALVDVREPDEHARARIPGAVSQPLSQPGLAPPAGSVVVYHCRSGARTAAHAAALAARAGGTRAFLLEGGLDAWRQAGLPIAEDRRQPIELMRQVQITAGGLVLLGLGLGALIPPWGFVLAGGVGAGLVFAGLSGTCGLAHLLRRMPWNRVAA